ncbi:ABC transporter substrate-binding protein [Myceligenerans pegani]|uniref:Sugar ABC transporter substrate-binding protein n=1 Tax=Myceligenerans pegani TaxID=2776917 RepID=A0ABR9N4T0_9MICO|nr:sugar ABC transporter substrate-binding protein [Myceligenerans sp. TRM 65318]MBE1878181.1 sugar ABC transporter substrate-binding protein [Myceligenerans sp. TRM 65318]MBE3020452.1 sugar ABC transporter substrate-binding protein [Myceligenerans sp. TRM 65318]
MATRQLRALAGIALGSVALLTASCAPGELEGESSGEQEVQELAPEDFAGLTLQYLYFTDGPDEQATRDLIAEFEEQYDVTVELEVLPYADLVTSTLNRLSSGNPPDVVRLTSLTDFRDDLLVLDPYLGDDYRDEFLPGPVSGAINAEDQLVAVPSDLTMNGPFVNVDLFEEAGVDVPDEWTWGEMIDAAQEVQDATGVPYAFAMDKSGHRLSTVLSEYGTQLVDSGGNALDIDKAEAALRPLVDLMADDDMPRDFWLGSGTRYEGANEIFLAGETPIYLSGNWQVGQFAGEATFDWAAAPNPCAEECGGFPGGKYMASFADAENPALAAEFIRFMNDAEHQEEFVSVSGQLPTRTDLSANGVTYTDEAAQAAMDTFLADLAVTPESGFEANGNPAFSPSADALVEEVSAVVDGQKELRPALEDLSEQIDVLVEETSS